MKIVILITVMESLAVMLAIMYFYYRRSQSRKRVSGIVGGAALFSTAKLKMNSIHCRSEEQTAKPRLKIKK